MYLVWYFYRDSGRICLLPETVNLLADIHFCHCTACIFLAESNIDENNITRWLKPVFTCKDDKSSMERVHSRVWGRSLVAVFLMAPPGQNQNKSEAALPAKELNPSWDQLKLGMQQSHKHTFACLFLPSRSHYRTCKQNYLYSHQVPLN